MTLVILLLSGFLLNIINHGNVLIGFLNILLLFFSVYFYLNYSRKNFSSIKSPYIILIAAIPLFIHKHDIFILLLALGGVLLFLLFLNTKLKTIFISVLLFYLIIASFYVSEILSFPFFYHSDLLIFSDHWANLHISQMEKEALYLPYKIRTWVFNNSVYFYVLLSKTMGLFMLKNLYDVLLIANLYPLSKGIVLDLKNWDRSKTLIILCILLISFGTVSSRTVNIFNTFTLLSPFILYFILRGFASINKTVYLLLFILSLVIATSP